MTQVPGGRWGRRSRRCFLSLGAAFLVQQLLGGWATASPLGSVTATARVLVSGLNAPKHITVGPGGELFVAESGSGGIVGGTNCATGPAAGGHGVTTYCEGTTGAIAEINAEGRVSDFASGLPSVVEADNAEIAGPAAVAFNHGWTAVVYQDELVGPTGANSLKGAARTTFGTVDIEHAGSTNMVDIARFAAAHPQAAATLGGPPHAETTYDSDPYDVTAYGDGFALVDAAANDLLFVSDTGKVSLLARFPTVAQPVPAHAMGNPKPITIDGQAVPTAVAVGPDGALYVSTLSGVPSEPGTARVYRVVPGKAPTVWASGLTAVAAIAFDGHDLLATELSVGGLLAPPSLPGALVKIGPNGKTLGTVTLSGVGKGLFDPTGVAVARNGTVYLSNNGTQVATAKEPGEILEVTGLS
ncbi:MAG: ScyD/ScyE family protein [Acidimicrobiales bacterium]